MPLHRTIDGHSASSSTGSARAGIQPLLSHCTRYDDAITAQQQLGQLFWATTCYHETAVLLVTLSI
jgi:hypothetical protein